MTRSKPITPFKAHLFACLLAVVVTPTVSLAAPSHLAALVIDARSGRVLHATNANRRVRPASLTKLMTTLLVLEYLSSSATQASQSWSITANAARQPATKLGLRAGRKITAGTVLDALLVASANDAAVVAAEAIAGSEATFAQAMNQVAKRLGMTSTRFANASGLPASPQFTTARDMAVLARYLWQRYPAERPRFALTGMNFAGRWVATHNPMLGSYRGARGMKTGFTCRAGFNLVALAERDGRTFIAVVLGAPGRQGRNALTRALLDKAFGRSFPQGAPTLAQLAVMPGQGDGAPAHSTVIAEPCLGIIGKGRGPSRWNIDVAVKRSVKESRAVARDFIRKRRNALPGARPFSIPRFTGVELHRAIITGVSEDDARKACLAYRDTGGFCVIFGPDTAALQLEQAARIRELQARAKAKREKVTNVRRKEP